MATIASMIVKIGADISNFNKNIEKARTTLNKTASNMKNIGSTLTTSVSLPIIGIGIGSVKMSADFEQAMANAASVSGATAEEFEKMKQVAREMGATTAFSAKEAGDAMYYMASAGWKANQMAEAIQPTLDLAAATQSDLAFTTDTVIATLNQFGMESKDTSKVTNVFAAAIGNSQATLEKLSYSMRYVGPVANSLGYSLEETTAALMGLYNAGFKGEQAGTVLRGALSRLMNPSKEAMEAISSLGLTFDQVNPATNSLADIIGILAQKGIDTATAVQLFGQEAGPGMMALINQGKDALIGYQDAITGTNAAGEMAKKQLDTLKGRFKILWSQISEVAIQIGDILIPIISDLVTNYIQPAVQWFSNLSDSVKKKILVVGLLVAAIGPLLLIIGQVISVVSALAGVFSFLASPIGLIVAAIVALAAVFIYLWNTSEEFRNAVLAIWEEIKTFGLELWNQLKVAFADIWNSIQETALAIWGEIQTFWENWGGTILAIGEGIWNQIKIVIETAINLVKDIIGLVLAIIRGDWEEVWNRIKSIGETIWNTITNTFENFKSTLVNIWESVKDKVLGVWDGIWKGIKEFINKIIRAMNGMIDGLNKLNFKIPKWIPGLGGKSFGLNIPHIPMLAEGGIVSKPTLAMIGEAGPEAVVPLDKYNNGQPVVYVYVTMDGEEISNKVDVRLGKNMLGLRGGAY